MDGWMGGLLLHIVFVCVIYMALCFLRLAKQSQFQCCLQFNAADFPCDVSSHLFDCHANIIRRLVMKKEKKHSFSFPAGAWLTVTCPRQYRAGTQQLLCDQ
jgi:hypothetical protein